MRARTRAVENVTVTGLASPASVASVGDAGRLMVLLPGDRARPVPATLAMAGNYVPYPGDTVLVIAGADDERYVIGVLASVMAPDRASVTLEGEPGREVVSVRDGDKRLLFEHHEAEGRSVVYAPSGHLELRAPDGDIELVAGGTVRVRASTAVEVSTGQASLEADDLRVRARTLASTLESARLVVGVIEVQAERIVERARNIYRDVEELAQTRAGRMRLVVENTYHLLGRRVLLKSDEDLKLKGEKIHLG